MNCHHYFSKQKVVNSSWEPFTFSPFCFQCVQIWKHIFLLNSDSTLNIYYFHHDPCCIFWATLLRISISMPSSKEGNMPWKSSCTYLRPTLRYWTLQCSFMPHSDGWSLCGNTQTLQRMRGTSTKMQNTLKTIFLKTCLGQQFFTDNSTFPSSASPCAKHSPQALQLPSKGGFHPDLPLLKCPSPCLLPLSITLSWHGKSTSGTHLQPSVPSRKGPAPHWNSIKGNGVQCQGELQHICSVLCSGQPSPQSFSRRGCSSGLIFKESGPSHPCCSFNDVNELQQGWNWAIIFYVHMSYAY